MIITLSENHVKVNQSMYSTNCFCSNVTKPQKVIKKIESSQSGYAGQPKYSECEVSELLGNCLWFDNWKDC